MFKIVGIQNPTIKKPNILKAHSNSGQIVQFSDGFWFFWQNGSHFVKNHSRTRPFENQAKVDHSKIRTHPDFRSPLYTTYFKFDVFLQSFFLEGRVFILNQLLLVHVTAITGLSLDAPHALNLTTWVQVDAKHGSRTSLTRKSGLDLKLGHGDWNVRLARQRQQPFHRPEICRTRRY